MGMLAGVAGLFFLLDSPFVALFQIAVYVGSIAVLILFTVMLVRRELIFKKIEDPRRKWAGIGLMLVMMVALGAIILDSGIREITTDEPAVDFRNIGEDFLTYYWPALVAMALILAGSVKDALCDRDSDQRRKHQPGGVCQVPAPQRGPDAGALLHCDCRCRGGGGPVAYHSGV